MSNNAWRISEDKYLIDNFSAKSTKLICQELNRSYDGVRRRASILNLKKANWHWTDQEIELLKTNFGKMDAKQLRIMLNKTKYAIHTKFRKLKSPEVETTGPNE